MACYKILQIIGGGEIGGAEQHVLTLLKGLDSQHFSPIVGCLIDGPFAQLCEESGLPTLRFPMKHALDLVPLPALIKEARQQEIALIHTHGTRANLLGRLAARHLRLPVVSTVHSSLKQDYLSRSAALLALTLDRLTLPLTTGLITVSEALAGELSDRGGHRIRTIYNGITTQNLFDDPSARAKMRFAFRQRWGIPDSSTVIGSIARLHPTKGLTYLIEAAKQLHPDFPHLHLLIIGDGPLRTELEQQLKEAAIPFTLTGFLPEACQALPAIDLFVLPSLSEGMGIVLLEAMQAGIPLIATRTGGVPEVVRDLEDGLLVPPGDPTALAAAIRSVLQNPHRAQEFVRSGHQRWQRFSSSEMLRQTKNFYEEILGGHNSNSRQKRPLK